MARIYGQRGKHLLSRCHEYSCHVVRMYLKFFFMFTITRLTCSQLTFTSSCTHLIITLHHVIVFVKDESNNLGFMDITLQSIIDCETLKFLRVYEGTCFGLQ